MSSDQSAEAGLSGSNPWIPVALSACLLLAGGCGGGADSTPAENPFGTGAGQPDSRTSRAPVAPMHVSAAPAVRPAGSSDTRNAAAGGVPAADGSAKSAVSAPANPSGVNPPVRNPGTGGTKSPAVAGGTPKPGRGVSGNPGPGGAPVRAAASSANWPRFRGPQGSGAAAVSDSAQSHVPVHWSDEENVLWRYPMPGPGSSSPIVQGNRVYVTCYTGYGERDGEGSPRQLERHVLCLDLTTGLLLWEYTVPQTSSIPTWDSFLTRHGYASASVVAAGETVYAFFDTAGAVALDAEGQQKWLQKSAAGQKTHIWGSASSPLVHDGMLLLTAGPESGAMVALSVKDGSVVWTGPGVEECWGTPVIIDGPGDHDQLILSMKGRIVAFDSFTGRELWSCRGIDDYICPSVVAGDGVVYAIGGRKGRAIAVRTGGKGDVTDSHVLWTADFGSNVPSPVLHEGRLMWVGDDGIAYCLDAATGALLGRRRTGADSVYASAVTAGGALYIVSQQRGTFVLKADKDLSEVARNRFRSDRSVFNATPAVLTDRLLLRSNEYVYCVGTSPTGPEEAKISSR